MRCVERFHRSRVRKPRPAHAGESRNLLRLEGLFDTFGRVGLTGFEPATSWSRTSRHTLESAGKQADSATSPVACTTACTSPPVPTPERPPSSLVTALLALAEQLSPADRHTLARLLLAET